MKAIFLIVLIFLFCYSFAFQVARQKPPQSWEFKLPTDADFVHKFVVFHFFFLYITRFISNLFGFK